jgi:hypothetical protein
MCGHQERAREAVEATPSAAEAAKAARSAEQPIGGILVNGSANPRPKDTIKTEASKQKGIESGLPASAK